MEKKGGEETKTKKRRKIKQLMKNKHLRAKKVADKDDADTSGTGLKEEMW